MLAMYLALLDGDADRQAFRALYEQHYSRLAAVARRYFPDDPKSAEDAVHNAFLQVIKHFDKINEIPRDKLPFWLVSIVKNESITLLRRQRRTVPLEDWDAFAQTAEEPGAVLGYGRVVELIRAMPETYRAALEMKLLEERTDREIARSLGISEGAVRGRICRGRALLRKKLLEEGYTP